MRQIDAAMQKSVWARVLGQTVPPALTPVELRGLAEREVRTQDTLRRLAARTWGRDAALLLRMASEERGHLRTLLALRYLDSGVHLAPTALAPACLRPLPEVLRAVHAIKCQAMEDYEAAARQRPDRAGTLLALAEDEHRHCAQLHALFTG